MAEQVIARSGVRQVARPKYGQSLGVVLFVLMGLLLFVLRVWLRTTPAATWTDWQQNAATMYGLLQALQQFLPALAILWTLASFAIVEAVYARVPEYTRPMSLGVVRAIVGFLAVSWLWELGAPALNNKLILVPLSDIWAAFVKLALNGELWKHTSVSLQEFALGYAAAAVVGILLGLLLATSVRLRDYLAPWVSFLYAVPLVAIAPLFIVAFGIGIMSKVVVIFLVAVFIVLVNTEVGVTSTDPHLIEAARSFGATRLQIFVKVLLPAALPFIVAGLRLGMARALVGVVVAELFGAKAGLGFLILASAQVFDTASLFVGVLVLAIGGYLGVELLKWIEFRLAPYRRFELKS